MFAHKKEYAHISKQMELVKPFIIFLELPVIFSPRRGALHLYIIERKKGVKIPAQRNPQTSPRRGHTTFAVCHGKGRFTHGSVTHDKE